MISINEFYRNRDVFITGATGLVGKVLIEKLLRSCPDIARIFVLLREKHSKNINTRLEEMKKIPVRFPFPFLLAINQTNHQLGNLKVNNNGSLFLFLFLKKKAL
jgi:FlaA1/EpsC-like NDP-sugar epimerase